MVHTYWCLLLQSCSTIYLWCSLSRCLFPFRCRWVWRFGKYAVLKFEIVKCESRDVGRLLCNVTSPAIFSWDFQATLPISRTNAFDFLSCDPVHGINQKLGKKMRWWPKKDSSCNHWQINQKTIHQQTDNRQCSHTPYTIPKQGTLRHSFRRAEIDERSPQQDIDISILATSDKISGVSRSSTYLLRNCLSGAGALRSASCRRSIPQ